MFSPVFLCVLRSYGFIAAGFEIPHARQNQNLEPQGTRRNTEEVEKKCFPLCSSVSFVVMVLSQPGTQLEIGFPGNAGFFDMREEKFTQRGGV